jgi:CO/xanthine dehydrogenase FAD-binding subunit
MVAYAAGRLSAGKLVSLWGIQELRFIETTSQSITIGAGTTFCDLRADSTIATELPLLAKASSWIGSIANQSRATIGGNLVNGSPAADSSPALLVYDAEIELVSANGRRRMPYFDFHTGYKQNAMTASELLFAIHFPRRFARYRQYLRKVGTRRAMAISKVALAGTALMQGNIVKEIRLAAASLAPYPARLYKTEAALLAQPITPETRRASRQALLAEAQPIDDIRSTAEYRKHVGANLLEEFLLAMGREDDPR